MGQVGEEEGLELVREHVAVGRVHLDQVQDEVLQDLFLGGEDDSLLGEFDEVRVVRDLFLQK